MVSNPNMTAVGNRGLGVGKRLPLSDPCDKSQRSVFELRLKVIQTAGEAYHQHAAVAGEQSYHRRFVRQQSIAEPLEVAGEFKRHLVERHAAKIRRVGFGNDGMSIKRKALRKPAPTDKSVTGTPRPF